MASANDFYGSPVKIAPTADSVPEMPETVRATSPAIAHFWVVMVLMLVAIRVLYEAAGKGA